MSELPQHRHTRSRTRPQRRRRVPPPPDPRREQRERKRLSRWMLIAGVLAGVGALGGALLSRGGEDAPPAETQIEALRADDPAALTLVDVRDVIDGTTLDVAALGTPLRVVLLGADAPDPGQPCAGEATARLAELAGAAVRLRADARQEDRLGRELRYAYTPDGASIDATLVAEGLALATRDAGALRDALVALEEDAHAAGRGCLWSGG